MKNQDRPAPQLSAFAKGRRAAGLAAMRDHDRKAITEAMQNSAGVVSRAAAALGIVHRHRFYQYAAACGLSIPALRDKAIADAAAKIVARAAETEP